MKASKNLADDVLLYMSRAYDGLNIENKSCSITPFGQKMPHVGRNDLLESTK